MMDSREMQARSVAKRWAGKTAEERSEAMRKVRAKGLKRTKKGKRPGS